MTIPSTIDASEGTMSKIPGDIRKAAEEALENSCHDKGRGWDERVNDIAVAILAERERCFDIANAEQREWQKRGPITGYCRGREGGASVIAALIRGEA